MTYPWKQMLKKNGGACRLYSCQLCRRLYLSISEDEERCYHCGDGGAPVAIGFAMSEIGGKGADPRWVDPERRGPTIDIGKIVEDGARAARVDEASRWKERIARIVKKVQEVTSGTEAEVALQAVLLRVTLEAMGVTGEGAQPPSPPKGPPNTLHAETEL